MKEGKMVLRPYQNEAIEAINKRFEAGCQNVLVAMATGTGKTETGLGWLQNQYDFGLAKRVLWIAHRQELIYQPSERVLTHWPNLPRPGIVMAETKEVAADFVVATIQTLHRQHNLDAVLSNGGFTHIIYDECHHAPSEVNLKVIRRLQENKPRFVGLTATPKRTDQDGLKKVFECVAVNISIFDAVYTLQCLVTPVPYVATIPLDISNYRGRAESGYKDEEIGSLLGAANIHEIIYEKWLEKAKDRPTIAFTASVAQAHAMAVYFKDKGVKAVALDGTTPDAERQQILRDYKSGQVQMVVNCQVLTEGFDAPETSCVLMAKPTRSSLVYVQCIGRGLRLWPNKQDCLILDFTPESERELVVSADDILGEPLEVKKARKKAEKQGTVLNVFSFLSKSGLGIDKDPDAVQMRALNLFGKNPLVWTFDGQLGTVSIGEKSALAITLPQEERVKNAQIIMSQSTDERIKRLYDVVSGFGVFEVNGKPRLLCVCQDYDSAVAYANSYVNTHGTGILNEKKKGWRSSPASAKQVLFAQRLKVWQDGMTRGQCAQVITHKLVMNALTSAGWLK